MDLISLFVAVPKAALFFLLIVGGAIVTEIFYFGKKKEIKISEITLPPSPLSTPLPINKEVVPPPPTVAAVEPALATYLPANPRSRFSKKPMAALLAVAVIVISIPIVVTAMKFREETRKQAAGEQYPAGCCFNDQDGNYRICPSGQTCDIPNGACGSGGKSCNPEGSGFHKACVGNQCVNVPGAGADDCPNNCQTQATPTPTPGCGGTDATCQNDEPDCCSKVCHYNKCANCSDYNGNEPVCHTHVNCHWEAGLCKDGALPPSTGGNCEINCSAISTGVSVTVKAGKETDCAGAVVSGSYYASTCGGTSGWCSGPSSSIPSGQSLPFSAGMMGHAGDCSWQSDITASTSKGGSCHDGSHGTLPCNTPTPTPTSTPTPTPTPTGTPPAYTAQCTDGRRVFAYPSWTPITNLATLTNGQTVYFTTTGTTNAPGGITKARFRINNGVSVSWCNGAGRSVVGLWCECNANAKHGNDFYIQYTIPSTGSYTVESMVFNQSLGWW